MLARTASPFTLDETDGGGGHGKTAAVSSLQAPRLAALEEAVPRLQVAAEEIGSWMSELERLTTESFELQEMMKETEREAHSKLSTVQERLSTLESRDPADSVRAAACRDMSAPLNRPDSPPPRGIHAEVLRSRVQASISVGTDPMGGETPIQTSGQRQADAAGAEPSKAALMASVRAVFGNVVAQLGGGDCRGEHGADDARLAGGLRAVIQAAVDQRCQAAVHKAARDMVQAEVAAQLARPGGAVESVRRRQQEVGSELRELGQQLHGTAQQKELADVRSQLNQLIFDSDVQGGACASFASRTGDINADNRRRDAITLNGRAAVGGAQRGSCRWRSAWNTWRVAPAATPLCTTARVSPH